MHENCSGYELHRCMNPACANKKNTICIQHAYNLHVTCIQSVHNLCLRLFEDEAQARHLMYLRLHVFDKLMYMDVQS